MLRLAITPVLSRGAVQYPWSRSIDRFPDSLRDVKIYRPALGSLRTVILHLSLALNAVESPSFWGRHPYVVLSLTACEIKSPVTRCLLFQTRFAPCTSRALISR